MLRPGKPHAPEKWSAEKARVLATGFIRVLVKRPTNTDGPVPTYG